MCLLVHHVACGKPTAVAAIGLLQLLWPNCASTAVSPDARCCHTTHETVCLLLLLLLLLLLP
jgi:hypothetical protein